MKRFFFALTALIGFSVAFFSCQKAPFLTMTGPRSFSYDHDGGTQTFAFACNRDWSISSSDSWVRVSPSSGKAADGDIMVTMTVSPNTTYDSRTTTLILMAEGLSETISVTQDMGLGLIVSPTSFDLTNEAQTIEIDVQKNVSYLITIDDVCKEWIKLVGTRALSTDKLSFSIAANDSYDNREGNITFKQTDGNIVQTVTVRQRQTNAILVKGEKEFIISQEGGSISVDLQTNVDLDVIIPEDCKTWVSLIETKSLSNKTLEFFVDENEAFFNREAVISLKDRASDFHEDLRFFQKQKDALFVMDATESHITKESQIIELVLFHNVSYSFITTTVPSWIKYDTQTIDGNTTKYFFRVSQNASYTRRDAVLLFKASEGRLQDTFCIIQEPTPIVYTDSDTFNLSKSGATFNLVVSSNVPYTIEKPDWIIETSSTQNEEPLLQTIYTYTVGATDENRIGTINFFWMDGESEKTTIVNINQSYVSCSINLTKAGTLFDYLGGYSAIREVNFLTVSGPINGSDIATIRKMNNLITLDISKATIVSGGGPYYTYSGMDLYTEENVVGRYMFFGLEDKFSTVYLPEGVTRIEYYAFANNLHFKHIYLPKALKRLEDCALINCQVLEEIDLPEGLEFIGRQMFGGAKLLKSITIPSTVKEISQWAFSCYAIEEIHVKALPTTLTRIAEGVAAGYYDTIKLYVPKGTKDEYYLTEFGKFSTILEE